MRRGTTLLLASGITLPSIGDAFMGGFFAGIIDTTKSNIIAADYYQTGKRYALISAGASLESATLKYKTADTAAPASSSTRWNGLDATAAMNSSTYPAAYYCYGLTPPSDAASRWYLPAMDELEVIYRVFKPEMSQDFTGSRSGSTFPGGAQYAGYNPSSDPTAARYGFTARQTLITAFKAGGTEAFSAFMYVSSTEFATDSEWVQQFTSSSNGNQFGNNKSAATSSAVRPVRRLVLP